MPELEIHSFQFGAYFQSHQMGATDREILEAHPELTQSDLINAWTYAETFPDEI